MRAAPPPRGRLRGGPPAPHAPGLPLHPLPTALAVLGIFVWILAFTPRPLAAATLPGVVGFLVAIERVRSLRRVLLMSILVWGIGIGIGYHWIAPTVVLFGGVPEGLAWLLTILFGVAGSVHLLIFILAYRLALRRSTRPHPLFTAALLVAAESLPIRLFPWMSGHGAVEIAPLRMLAQFGGVPAVSFALLCLTVPVRELLYWSVAPLGGARPRPKAAVATLAVGLALALVGWWQESRLETALGQAPGSLRIGIVQGGIGSLDKRSAESSRRDARSESIQRYREGSEVAVRRGAELILWPETAITDSIPFSLPRAIPERTQSALARGEPDYAFLEDLGRERAFLVGAYETIPAPREGIDPLAPTDRRHNVAALRLPGGREATWTVYRKVHLIPFGEQMPMGLPESYLPQGFRMAPAPGPQGPLRWRDLAIVPFLCYEGILADHVRAVASKEHPHLLVSLANDSWFGDTWEPRQHLNFTRFRAVEHAAPLARATNTGISAFVTPAGAVVAELGLTEEGVLIHDVPLLERGPTPYVRYGHHLPLFFGALALLGLLFGTGRAPRPR